jgi:hypothetical protein
MSNGYLLLLRNQNNQISAVLSHDQAGRLEELSVLHTYLLKNLQFGAVRAELHSLLPKETLSQARERIQQDHPRPLAAVTKDDLSAQEIEEQVG